MQQRNILYSIMALAAVFATACGHSESTPQPFKGYWKASAVSDSADNAYIYSVRLDPYDSTVCDAGQEKVVGVLSIAEDRAVPRIVTSDVIKEMDIDGNTAHVKYVQESSGQLWTGTLHFDPSDSTLTFENGEMLAPGQSGDTVPVNLPYDVNPSTLTFEHESTRPNFKSIPTYNLVLQLPDRVYYRNILADESIEPPFGDVQLRCYYPATDEDVHITNEIGESPLSSKFDATIVDCWPLTEAPGLMIIVWNGNSGGFQQSTLYRVDNHNTFEELDYVSGRRPARYDSDEKPDAAEISSMIRNGKKVKVYDPDTRETRLYDLNGHRL